MADTEYTEKKRAAFCAVKAAMDMLVAVTEPKCGALPVPASAAKVKVGLPINPHGTASLQSELKELDRTINSTQAFKNAATSAIPTPPPPPSGPHPENLLEREPKNIKASVPNPTIVSSGSIPPPPPPKANSKYNFNLNEAESGSGAKNAARETNGASSADEANLGSGLPKGRRNALAAQAATNGGYPVVTTAGQSNGSKISGNGVFPIQANSASDSDDDGNIGRGRLQLRSIPSGRLTAGFGPKGTRGTKPNPKKVAQLAANALKKGGSRRKTQKRR